METIGQAGQTIAFEISSVPSFFEVLAYAGGIQFFIFLLFNTINEFFTRRQFKENFKTVDDDLDLGKFLKLLSQVRKSPAFGAYKPAAPKAVEGSSSASYHIEGEDSAEFRPAPVENPEVPRDEFGRPLPFDPSMVPDVRDEFGRKRGMDMTLARRITNKIMRMNTGSKQGSPAPAEDIEADQGSIHEPLSKTKAEGKMHSNLSLMQSQIEDFDEGAPS